MKPSFLLAALLSVAIVGCGTTDPNDPGGDTTPGTITMVKRTDLPRVGGDVTDLRVAANGDVIALMKGDLYRFTTPEAAPEVIVSGRNYSSFDISPAGDLYAISGGDVHAYDGLSGQPRITTSNFTSMEGGFAFGSDGAVYSWRNTNGGGYFHRSTDRGASWTELTGVSPLAYGGMLAVAADGSLLVAGTQKFFRSTDGGATFTSTGSLSSGFHTRMLVAPNGDVHAWAPAVRIYGVSRDNGASFQMSAFSPQEARPLDLTTGPNGEIYAIFGTDPAPGVVNELRRSTDRGSTWRKVFVTNGETLGSSGSRIAIGRTALEERFGGVALSSDNGVTWRTMGTRQVDELSDILAVSGGKEYLVAREGLFLKEGGAWRQLAFQPGGRVARASSGNLLYATPASVSVSTDGGSMWTTRAITDYYPARGAALVSGLVPRSDGSFLLALIAYENPGVGYNSGTLYTVDINATPSKVLNFAMQFTDLQNIGNVTYGKEARQNFGSVWESFVHTSADGGMSWTVQNQTTLGLATNSQGRTLVPDGVEYSKVILQTPNWNGSKKELSLKNFGSDTRFIVRGHFGPDDRLYLITTEGELYESTGGVR